MHVLYLILKLKLSFQNVNSISHLRDKAQLHVSCNQEVQPSGDCACMTWQKQIQGELRLDWLHSRQRRGWREVI